MTSMENAQLSLIIERVYGAGVEGHCIAIIAPEALRRMRFIAANAEESFRQTYFRNQRMIGPLPNQKKRRPWR